MIYKTNKTKNNQSVKVVAFEAMVMCENCNSDESGMSDMEGYQHLCNGCACEKFDEDLEKQWSEELLIYSKRVNKNYDFNRFCFGCWGKISEVDEFKLKGLSELSEIYKCERYNYSEYTKPLPAQTEMNFSGLPF